MSARAQALVESAIGAEFGEGPAATALRVLAEESGAPGPSPFPVSDAVFAVYSAGNATKLLEVDASGQALGTTATITLGASVSRPFRLPDISGTALVAQDATQFVFVGATGQLHGSNAGIQYSVVQNPPVPIPPTTLNFTNRAQIRFNLYGNNLGAPGMTGFKSRGATVGAMGGCQGGDTLLRLTAIGVTPNNLDIPLAALLNVQVPAAFVAGVQNYLPSEVELLLVPMAGPINGARLSQKDTSEGQHWSLRGSRAGSETAVYLTTAAAAAAIPTGAMRSSDTGPPEGVVTGTPGDIYSDKGSGDLYVKQTGVGPTGWVVVSADPFNVFLNRYDLSVNQARVENARSRSPIMRTGTSLATAVVNPPPATNPGGGFTGGGTGNKAIFGFKGHSGVLLSAITNLTWEWENIAPAETTGTPFLFVYPYVNLLVELAPALYKILSIDPNENARQPLLNIGALTNLGGDNWRFVHDPALHNMQIVNAFAAQALTPPIIPAMPITSAPTATMPPTLPVPLPPPYAPWTVCTATGALTPPSPLPGSALAWNNYGWTWASLIAAYPVAKLIDVYTADGGLPGPAGTNTPTPSVMMMLGDSSFRRQRYMRIANFTINGLTA
jgi:hypothetical protein